MPVHDWTRVEAGIFHSFHLTWIGILKKSLNLGMLPPNYYALAEQVATATALGEPIYQQWVVVIHHVSDHRTVALIEILSPGNKSNRHAIRLPDMPLFLTPEEYINVPLETTYRAAYKGVPRYYRTILETGAASNGTSIPSP